MWRPDGRQIAVAPQGDSIVRTFNVDGLLSAELKGMTGHVYCVAWSPDGKRIAAGAGHDNGGQLQIWTPDGGAGASLNLDATVSFVEWSPNSRQLAFSKTNVIYVWNLEDEQAIHVAGVTGNRQKDFWSPDSKWLVLNEPSGATQLFAPDATPGVKVGRNPDSVVWSHDGSRLLLADKNRTTQWFRVDGTSFPPTAVAGSTADDRYFQLAWSPDCRRVAFAGNDGNVLVWNDNGEREMVLGGHQIGSSIDVAWSPNGKWLASAGYNKLRLWKLDGTPGRVLNGTSCVGWSPDSEWLVSGLFASRGAQLWRPDGTKGPTIEEPTGVGGIAWSPDGKRFALLSRPTLAIFEADGTPGPVMEGLGGPPGRPLAWSPDGKWIAGSGQDQQQAMTVRVWNSDGTPGPTLEKQKNLGTFHLAWSPDSTSLTAWQQSGLVSRWGMDGKLQESRQLDRDVVDAAPTPDGEQFAIRRASGTVAVHAIRSPIAKWVGLPLTDGQFATFTAGGQLVHAPPEIEKQLIYVIERPNGQFAAMSRRDFVRRVSLSADKLALQRMIQVGGSFALEGDEKIYSAATVKTFDDLPAVGDRGVNVNLHGNELMTADDLKLLAAVKSLTGLDLSQTAIDDSALEQIGKLTSLGVLDLSQTRIRGEGLSQLTGLKMLSVLRLKKTLISASALEHLSRLTQLRELHLSDTAVSDFGLRHLNKLTNLKSLDLTGTSVTPRGISALKEKLPQCKIVSGHNPATPQ